jgi:hypothetical protein
VTNKSPLFIDRELVESELNATRALSDRDALSSNSDYLKLSSKGFELLLYTLFESVKDERKFDLTLHMQRGHLCKGAQHGTMRIKAHRVVDRKKGRTHAYREAV